MQFLLNLQQNRIYRMCKKTEQIGNRFLLLEGPQCTKFFIQIDFLEKFKISKRGGCLFLQQVEKGLIVRSLFNFILFNSLLCYETTWLHQSVITGFT